jgi:hypothetical protein
MVRLEGRVLLLQRRERGLEPLPVPGGPGVRGGLLGGLGKVPRELLHRRAGVPELRRRGGHVPRVLLAQRPGLRRALGRKLLPVRRKLRQGLGPFPRMLRLQLADRNVGRPRLPGMGGKGGGRLRKKFVRI